MRHTIYYDSPIGRLTLASDGESLTGLWIEGQKYYGGQAGSNLTEPEERAAETEKQQELPVFCLAKSWLDRYFRGEKPEIKEVPIKPEGSLFRRTVWEILCEIPYGQTVTYGEIARQAAEKLGKETMSAQAVGGAVGHNPVSVIIPCHRVVGAQGSLTGYAGGIERKLWLLELEGVDTSAFFRPKKGTAL